MARRPREHNEWFRKVSLGDRKSCPECKTKLDPGQSIWSWFEYRITRQHIVKRFCKHCFEENVKKLLVDHVADCGCAVNLVGYHTGLPSWLTLEAACQKESYERAI